MHKQTLEGIMRTFPFWVRFILQQLALVAQRIEHLTTDQKVRGSNPFKRTLSVNFSITEPNASSQLEFGNEAPDN